MRIFFLLLFAILAQGSIAQDEPLETHDDWRLKKDEDGIQVYTRWIEASDVRKARQVKVEMSAKASIEDFLAILKDDENGEKWVYRAKEFYNFDFKDDCWYTYTELSIPWPFQNKDLITKNTLIRLPAEQKVRVDLTGISDYLPEKKSLSRIPHFEGGWTFTQVGVEEVRVQYLIFTKSEPVLPRWIIDPIVEQGAWDTLNKMRSMISTQNKTYARQVK